MRKHSALHILLVLCLLLPHAAALSRDGYLQQVTKTGAIVTWVGAAGSVEYGTAVGTYPNSVTATNAGSTAAGNHWAATITGLTPGTKYYYQVKEGGAVVSTGPEYYFVTDAAASPAKWGFAVAGDPGEPGWVGSTFNSIDQQTPRPDFVLIPGDVVYSDGRSADYDNNLMRPIKAATRHMAVYPVRGNHDWHTPGDFAKEWILPGAEHYYIFEWANAVIINIDGGESGSMSFEWSQQLSMLNSALQQYANKDWKIVQWHHPGYTCTYKGDNGGVISKLLPILAQNKVDFTFTGHAHVMEVTHPMTASGQVVNGDQRPNYVNPGGILHVVAGSAGKTSSGTNMACNGRTQNQFTAEKGGFAYVTIEGRKATVRMISQNNQVLYEYTVTKTGGTTCADSDGDGAQDRACGGTDCNDGNPAIKPGATEVCGNNIDDNCNTQTDEGCPATCTTGQTRPCTTAQSCAGTETCASGAWGACTDTPNDNCPAACTVGGGCTVSGTGCAGHYNAQCLCTDDVPTDNCPAAVCIDNDRDGFGNPPANCANTAADCNDNNAAIKPGAAEVCTNGVDDNCNSLIDSGDPACVPATCADTDRDGYGNPATYCDNPLPDCNDQNGNVRPNATEACTNGLDDNCNSYIDAQDPACSQPCATDTDHDGYKAEASCGAARDCADLNPEISPAKPERCGNLLDDDCDGLVDEGCTCNAPQPCDADCDGVLGAQCGGPDCHDGNPSIRPNITEACGNRIDDNCDTLIDTPCGGGCVNPPACDGDCDGVLAIPCGGPDCHDGNAAIRPNATEVCTNGIDDNCNAYIDAGDPACQANACATDADRDGFKAEAACGAARDCNDRNASQYPGAVDICDNGVDEDCNGQDKSCRTFRCDGDIPISSCDSHGNFCLPNLSLAFNCYVCACPSGQSCVDNRCVSGGACAPPCAAGEVCEDGECFAADECNPPCIPGFVCEGGECLDSSSCDPEWTCGEPEPATCPSATRLQHRTCTQTNCPDVASSREEPMLCVPSTPCGNGRPDPGEDCDGDTSQLTCAAIDANLRGDLRCREDCRYDTGNCCTTERPTIGRRGPSIPRCSPEVKTVDDTTPPKGNGDQTPTTQPRVDSKPDGGDEAQLESPRDWYTSPLNLGLILVILGLGLYLYRQGFLRRILKR